MNAACRVLLLSFLSLLIACSATQSIGSNSLDFEVIWVLQGREFSFTGFFLEFLGISSALRRKMPQMRLIQSSYSYFFNESALTNQKMLDQLFSKELDDLYWLYGSDRYEPNITFEDNILFGTGNALDDRCSGVAEDFVSPEVATTMLNMWRPTVRSSTTAAECCNACARTLSCIGWSMSKAKGSDKVLCQLKGQLSETVTAQQLAAATETEQKHLAAGSLLRTTENPKGVTPKPR